MYNFHASVETALGICALLMYLPTMQTIPMGLVRALRKLRKMTCNLDIIAQTMSLVIQF